MDAYPICFLVSMAAIHCVFHQLASQGVKILLSKLAVGAITKQKHTFQNKNRHFNTERTVMAVALFLKRKKKVCELSMFLNSCKHIMVFLFFSTAKKLHTAPLRLSSPNYYYLSFYPCGLFFY